MIRRDPTVIPMSDLDVQDVRDMLAQQKQDMQSKEKLMATMKRLAETAGITQEDITMLEVLKKKERATRIGLNPCWSNLHSFYGAIYIFYSDFNIQRCIACALPHQNNGNEHVWSSYGLQKLRTRPPPRSSTTSSSTPAQKKPLGNLNTNQPIL